MGFQIVFPILVGVVIPYMTQDCKPIPLDRPYLISTDRPSTSCSSSEEVGYTIMQIGSRYELWMKNGTKYNITMTDYFKVIKFPESHGGNVNDTDNRMKFITINKFKDLIPVFVSRLNASQIATIYSQYIFADNYPVNTTTGPGYLAGKYLIRGPSTIKFSSYPFSSSVSILRYTGRAKRSVKCSGPALFVWTWVTCDESEIVAKVAKSQQIAVDKAVKYVDERSKEIMKDIAANRLKANEVDKILSITKEKLQVVDNMNKRLQLGQKKVIQWADELGKQSYIYVPNQIADVKIQLLIVEADSFSFRTQLQVKHILNQLYQNLYLNRSMDPVPMRENQFTDLSYETATTYNNFQTIKVNKYLELLFQTVGGTVGVVKGLYNASSSTLKVVKGNIEIEGKITDMTTEGFKRMGKAIKDGSFEASIRGSSTKYLILCTLLMALLKCLADMYFLMIKIRKQGSHVLEAINRQKVVVIVFITFGTFAVTVWAIVELFPF